MQARQASKAFFLNKKFKTITMTFSHRGGEWGQSSSGEQQDRKKQESNQIWLPKQKP